MFNNIIIHYYPNSPAVVKCGVNLRIGNKIVLRTALKDIYAVNNWISRNGWTNKKRRVIVHWGV